jgi:CHAT domain-containing protein
VDQQSLHLIDAQIEQYGDTSNGTDVDASQEIEAHVADCPACLNRLLLSHRTCFALMREGSVNISSYPARRGPHCPTEEDLRKLVAGLCPSDQAIKLTQHAAQCDHCGPLLRMYSEDFSEELDKENEAVLGKVKSSSVKWQMQMVSEIFAGSKTAPMKSVTKSFLRRWMQIPAAVTACAAIALAVWYSRLETPEKVEKLLAQAYTEQRMTEFRFPGAAWAEPRTTRGPRDSRFSKPASLLRAETIISDRQSTDPNNVAWLRAKGEAEIIEGQPDAAIVTLNHALEAQPESPLLMLDSAIAYFAQAEHSHERQGYLKAIDLLSKIIKKDPDNQEALFNLALTYTRTEMWDQAVQAWQSYLDKDQNGPWAVEAGKRQKEAQAKSKLHAASLDTDSVLAMSEEEMDFDAEQYQDTALRNWIVRAVTNPESVEYQATSRLAQIMSRRHSDLWLQDFLGRSTNRGAVALSAVITSNANGHYAQALKNATEAQNLFKREHNLPGELRVRFESVYAYQRLLHGADCLSRADPLQREAAATTYHWLQAQLAIERAICLNYHGRLSAADSELSSSLTTAQRFNFPLLSLRCIGISQGLKVQQGKYEEAWNLGISGLHEYWTHPSSAQREYQFYASSALSAEHMELWSAAENLLRRAIKILSAEEDSIQRGAAQLELAKILIAENQDPTAEYELIEANRLFDRDPGEPTARSYLLNGKIGLAEIQFKRGRPIEALSTLKPAEELLSEADGYFVFRHYYQLLGNISFQLKHLDPASEAYKLAIVMVEKSLGEIRSDRDRLQWLQAADDAYRGVVRVLAEEHNQEDSLKLWEWYESRPSQENTVVATTPKKADKVSWPSIWAHAAEVSWQEDQTARLVYAVFNDGIQIWAISKSKLTGVWVPIIREKLEKMVQQFSQGCARPDSALTEVLRHGQELFSLLLQPVIDELPVGSVIAVELDRSLTGLPLEALHSPSGWFLAERYAVVYSPGILHEKHLRNPEPVNVSQSFLLADASEGKGGIYLPGSELERDTISRLFPKTTIAGSEADLAEVQALLPKSDIFGFMGHGEPNGTGTTLHVGPRLLLRAEDFSPKILHRLHMAVLSACSTGSGGENGLLDNRNLVHAFLAGGVPTVIASNWNVDSAVTAELMKVFYEHVSKGGPIVVAMSVARNEVRKIHMHPFFWAGFSFIGKAN